MASFNTLCNQLIDMWVQSESLETPKDLYGPIIREVSIKMGLSIVEMIVSHLGGRISLSNHPDGGLLATLVLPQAPHSEPNSNTKRNPERSP